MTESERENTPERRDPRIRAMEGLLKAYADIVCSGRGYPAVYQTEVELRSGEKKGFVVFGSFTRDEDETKPEILVVTSTDTDIRAVATAHWDGDYPEVEEVDSFEGTVTIGGTVSNITDRSLTIPDPTTMQQDLVSGEREFIEVLNKLSLNLRFSILQDNQPQ